MLGLFGFAHPLDFEASFSNWIIFVSSVVTWLFIFSGEKAFVARRRCLRRHWGWEGHWNRKRKWWWCCWGGERQNMKAECWRNKQWVSRAICSTHRHTHVVGMVAIYVFFVCVLWAPTHEPTYLSPLTCALWKGDIGSPTSIWAAPVCSMYLYMCSDVQLLPPIW